MSGRLVLCATPIGNLADAPPRLAETLAEASLVLAEDTRRAKQLLSHLGVAARVASYFVGNEEARRDLLAAELVEGGTVALVTDAGMPTVSDPGLSAVQVAREVGATVSVVPGPSAALSALALSGLPSERFVFEGFLPRKGRERSVRLDALAEEERTIILFAATSRVVTDLEALADRLGEDRAVTVCRELTKLHEEVWSGSLRGAIDEWTNRAPRGEFTVVVAGRVAFVPAMTEAIRDVLARMDGGEALSDAVRAVAESLDVRRRALYEAVLATREE